MNNTPMTDHTCHYPTIADPALLGNLKIPYRLSKRLSDEYDPKKRSTMIEILDYLSAQKLSQALPRTYSRLINRPWYQRTSSALQQEISDFKFGYDKGHYGLLKLLARQGDTLHGDTVIRLERIDSTRRSLTPHFLVRTCSGVLKTIPLSRVTFNPLPSALSITMSGDGSRHPFAQFIRHRSTIREIRNDLYPILENIDYNVENQKKIFDDIEALLQRHRTSGRLESFTLPPLTYFEGGNWMSPEINGDVLLKFEGISKVFRISHCTCFH